MSSPVAAVTPLTRFYLGTHQPAWLASAGVPLFVSHRRLVSRRGLPRARAAWALDSGGFTELAMHGRWETTPAVYVAAVRRYCDEVGHLEWAAPQDWMCEPFMVSKTGLTVLQHQERTVANYLELRTLAPDLPFTPVLQGWTLADYHRCADLYARAGVDLVSVDVVGLGSVCCRQSTGEIAVIVESLAGRGLRLHGFGVKTAGLARYGDHLASADSLAWSYEARRSEPLPGHQHQNCANCLPYALGWRERVLRRLRHTQLRLPWEGTVSPVRSTPRPDSTASGYRKTPDPMLAVVAPDALRCDHCGQSFVPPARRRGSPTRFCCPAHREAARLRRERGLPEDHPVVPNRHGRCRLRADCAESP